MGITQAVKDIQKALRKHYSEDDEFTIIQARANVPGLECMSYPGIEAAFTGRIIPGLPGDDKWKLKELYDFDRVH